MISFMHYAKGKQTIGEGADYPTPKEKELLFVMLSEPSAQEIERVTKDFHANKKALQSFAKWQNPKRISSDPLSFVLIDYYLNGEEIKHSRLFLHLEKNVLVVAVPERSDYYSALFHTICSDFMKHKEERDIAHVLYNFLDTDTKDTYDVLTKTEGKIIAIEEKLLETAGNDDVREITKLKRFLYKMARRLWANAKLVYLLKKGLTPVQLRDERLAMFDDVYDTFMHQIDIVTSQKEMLSDALQIYSTNLNNRLTEQGNELNAIMKRLTGLTIILMVPALIAGVYGMNFRNMPELYWEHGYYLAMLAMFLSVVGGYALFRKYKYL